MSVLKIKDKKSGEWIKIPRVEGFGPQGEPGPQGIPGPITVSPMTAQEKIDFNNIVGSPTNIGDLDNDSAFITQEYLQSLIGNLIPLLLY